MVLELTTERIPLPTQEQFDSAIEDFRKAAKQIYDLLIKQSGLKQAVILRKNDLACIADRIAAEGVAGSNKEQRDAALKVAVQKDEEHRQLRQDQIVDEAELGRVEASLELWRDARSISKRRAEAWIAVHQAAGRD